MGKTFLNTLFYIKLKLNKSMATPMSNYMFDNHLKIGVLSNIS